MTLIGERILLGVSGGIAAYKAPDLVRRLRDAGAEVRVVLTDGAQAFVGPLTFQAVAHTRVHTELLDSEAEAGMGHIELARWATRVVIAPASANCLARLAHGFANDLLSTLCLATQAPITVCPAMNHIMWQAPATKHNLAQLEQRGIRILGPIDGPLAEGESGPGRLMEPLDIVQALSINKAGALAGKTLLITAGPTHEPIDPVRFIGNRSSGRMGYAIATAAAQQGATVTLISGPTALSTPHGVERINVSTALEMHDAVMQHIKGKAIFIAAAAVADYRIATPAAQKIKKSTAQTSLTLIPNPDIVAEAAALPDRPYIVGFAAETEAVIDNARAKRERKGLDMIAANQVGPGLGFDTEDNCLHILSENAERTLGPAPKPSLANELLLLIADAVNEQH